MDFYPNDDASAWSKARDNISDVHRMRLQIVPQLVAGSTSMSVPVAMAMTNEIIAAIEGAAEIEMNSIEHLKRSK
jgi:hypothetical protein